MERLVGRQLKRMREAQGLTQRELGDLLSVSDVTISRYETGDRGIEADELPRIARALEVDCAAFFAASDCPEARALPTAPTVPGAMTAELAVHVARELGIAREEQRRSLELAARILTIMARHAAPPEGEDTDTA